MNIYHIAYTHHTYTYTFWQLLPKNGEFVTVLLIMWNGDGYIAFAVMAAAAAAAVAQTATVHSLFVFVWLLFFFLVGWFLYLWSCCGSFICHICILSGARSVYLHMQTLYFIAQKRCAIELTNFHIRLSNLSELSSANHRHQLISILLWLVIFLSLSLLLRMHFYFCYFRFSRYIHFFFPSHYFTLIWGVCVCVSRDEQNQFQHQNRCDSPCYK